MVLQTLVTIPVVVVVPVKLDECKSNPHGGDGLSSDILGTEYWWSGGGGGSGYSGNGGDGGKGGGGGGAIGTNPGGTGGLTVGGSRWWWWSKFACKYTRW